MEGIYLEILSSLHYSHSLHPLLKFIKVYMSLKHDHMLHRTGLLTEAQVRGSKATVVCYLGRVPQSITLFHEVCDHVVKPPGGLKNPCSQLQPCNITQNSDLSIP